MDFSFSKERIKHLLLLLACCYLVVHVSLPLQCQLAEKFRRQMKGGSHTTLHLEAFARSLEGDEFARWSTANESEEEPTHAAGTLYSSSVIYRVPDTIRRMNEDAYSPQVVAIGPYHHYRLRKMDDYKTIYLQSFLGRTRRRRVEFVNLIINNERYLRNRYSEPILMNTTELVEMVLEDAAFIFELFYRLTFEPFPISKLRGYRAFFRYNESFPTTPYVVSLIKNDLLMFENQLPFPLLSVLLHFAQITAPKNIEDPISKKKNETPPSLIIKQYERLSLVKLTYMVYSNRPSFRVGFVEFKNLSSISYYHFLDFLRQVHLPLYEGRENRSRARFELDFSQVPSVTELQQAGVEFRKASTSNLFNVIFNRKKGVLEIPRFYLSGVTEILFRNLLIYEQFCFPDHQHIADYMRFLSVLVKEQKDVEILVQSGSFDNGLDDINAAITLIHSILRFTYSRTEGFYFSDIFKELVSYYHNPWHVFVAKWKQDYFNTPWAAIIAVAGAVGVLCGILQTVFAILSYRRKKE